MYRQCKVPLACLWVRREERRLGGGAEVKFGGRGWESRRQDSIQKCPHLYDYHTPPPIMLILVT